MKEKERNKFNSEGIFTVTQLSCTFRPRRRPKRLRGKREKYHHAIKALAIREKKIHIVGLPELKIDGTPAYLDVEDEKKAWNDFLVALAAIEHPVLIHYGSYETIFLRRMSVRYGGPPEDSTAAKVISSAINI